MTCCYVEKDESCDVKKYEKGKGNVGTQLVGERAHIILDEVRDFITRRQCLEHIGTYYCLIMAFQI